MSGQEGRPPYPAPKNFRSPWRDMTGCSLNQILDARRTHLPVSRAIACVYAETGSAATQCCPQIVPFSSSATADNVIATVSRVRSFLVSLLSLSEVCGGVKVLMNSLRPAICALHNCDFGPLVPSIPTLVVNAFGEGSGQIFFSFPSKKSEVDRSNGGVQYGKLNSFQLKSDKNYLL